MSSQPAPRVVVTDPLLDAINRGVRKALIDHKRNGDPIVVWKDGKVVWVPAEEIDIPDEPPAEAS